jgi:hypothetical protein
MSSLAMKLSLPATPVPMPQAAVSWTAQIIAAIIMGQTLFFKFTGAPEPVYIFTTLGAEPWGRLGTAVLELVAVVLLLTPRTALLGAALGMGLMFGAIGSHLTKLGIVVKDDGGLLFAMALVTFAACAAVVFIRRAQLAAILAHLRN